MKGRKKKKGQKQSYPDLVKTILGILDREAPRHFTSRQILKKTRSGNNINDVRKILDKLVRSKHVLTGDDGRFYSKLAMAKKKGSGMVILGTLDAIRSGAAFVISEDLDSDVFVPQKFVGGAYNGDTVKVEIFKRARGRRKEGKVIEIVERSRTHFTGVYRDFPNNPVVVVTDKRSRFEVEIEKGGKVPKDFDKVVVEITHWPPHKSQALRGSITMILGTSGSNDAEMLSLLIDKGFALKFNKHVNEEAAKLEAEADFTLEEDRLDMRSVTTITIDPADAKDFDDALSYRQLENGNIEIGVHIADVSHYVKPGTALDKEAADRGNSVYLVDRVLPMLPENLSNGLCSLRPDEEKFTFSVLCEFDKNHKLKKHRFTKTLINSNRRFAYEEAQECIESGKGDFATEIGHMNRIAHTLRAERIKNGSIGFETDEVRFVLDDDGKPLSVYVKKRQDAHLMIEDFMLLANKLVAKFISDKGENKPIPFPYRIHDQPDPDKLLDFSLLAQEFGLKFKLSTPRQIADSLNELMDKAREDDAYKILVPLAIRSMAKAEYNTENIGHFGLGFEYYGHFTSPIRRYADLIVHRVLYDNLTTVNRSDAFKMDAICTHISSQERKAQEAERESVKFKQAEFLKEREGEIFTGVVVSIIDKGFFVTLKENLCEGMVAFDTVGERVEIDELSSSFTGRKTGRHVKLGDEIQVQVDHADLFTRRVDLLWVDEA